MSEIGQYLNNAAPKGFLSWDDQQKVAHHFKLDVRRVEEIALQLGIVPSRYQRNQPLLSCQDQLCLLSSHVAVIGCGGLGGHVIEGLARLGVGQLTVIDPDVFEENNLNRQLLATFATLGRHKVDVAVERVAHINPVVTVTSWRRAFSHLEGAEMLSGATVVVDALDNIAARLDLSALCRDLDMPLVHGAIDGYYGQVLSLLPPDYGIETLYADKVATKRLYSGQGNPSFTPAVVAALEVSEVVKIILGRGVSLRHRLLNVNLLDMEFVEVPISPSLCPG
jgi:molybdopterin/thiamine biosynthesis adenylyltransferase